MSMLHLARETIQFARTCVPLKSDNKGYGQLGPPGKVVSGDVKLARNTAMAELKAKMPARNCTMDDVLHYGRHVMGVKAGNCFEQCSAAAVHLAWQLRDGAHRFELVTLGDPGDHIFIAIDQQRSGAKFLKDFASWDANAVVCDPWAKIACPARDYPDEWQEKLDKWADRRLELSYPKGDRPGWKKANDAVWYNAVAECEKLPYTV